MKTALLAPEDWLALVIAAQAHHSSSPAHAGFGSMLITKYFDEIPKQYNGDKTAAAYFEAILCHVAAAIRGFAVIRQIFTTEVAAVHSVRDLNVEAIKRLQGLGP